MRFSLFFDFFLLFQLFTKNVNKNNVNKLKIINYGIRFVNFSNNIILNHNNNYKRIKTK